MVAKSKKKAAKLPKYIDLCGIRYRVRLFSPNRSNSCVLPRTAAASIDPNRREICIEQGRSDIGYILLHEFIHDALDAIYPDPNTKEFRKYYGEELVRPFTRVLWAALKSAGIIDKKFI